MSRCRLASCEMRVIQLRLRMSQLNFDCCMRPRRRQRKGRHPNQESKPPQERDVAIAKVQELPEPTKSEMLAVLTSMEPPFWTMKRKEQVVALADKGQ